MKLLHFQSTLIEDSDNTRELDDAIEHAREFAGYNEDDPTTALCTLHHHEYEDDEYFGKWTVDRDNKGPEANPTESEMLAGPFDTEDEARAAAFDLDEQSAPHVAEYELPEGVSLIHAETGSSRSRFGHNASVIVRFNGEDYDGDSHSDGSYGRMSQSESGSIVVALERAVAEAIGSEWEAIDMSESAVAAREKAEEKDAAKAEQDAKAKALGFQFARRFTSSEGGFRQMKIGEKRISSRGVEWLCIEAHENLRAELLVIRPLVANLLHRVDAALKLMPPPVGAIRINHALKIAGICEFISEHAIIRYCQRCTKTSRKNALEKIRNSLCNAQEIFVVDDFRASMMLKHGQDARYFRSGDMTYIICAEVVATITTGKLGPQFKPQ